MRKMIQLSTSIFWLRETTGLFGAKLNSEFENSASFQGRKILSSKIFQANKCEIQVKLITRELSWARKNVTLREKENASSGFKIL